MLGILAVSKLLLYSSLLRRHYVKCLLRHRHRYHPRLLLLLLLQLHTIHIVHPTYIIKLPPHAIRSIRFVFRRQGESQESNPDFIIYKQNHYCRRRPYLSMSRRLLHVSLPLDSSYAT